MKPFERHFFDIKKFNFLMVFIGALLLSVWALVNTIALRNVLLILGAILSLIYLYKLFKEGENSVYIGSREKLLYSLIGLIFFWVFLHYFFFGEYKDIQLHELRSTWLRSFLAVLLGGVVGISVLRVPNSIYVIWSAISCSFIFLIYQYIPNAINNNKIFIVPTYYAKHNYIFFGKINGLLMGMILMSGLSGSILDYFVRKFKTDQNYCKQNTVNLFALGFFWLFNLMLLLYVFVFIFDTLAGIGFMAILLLLSSALSAYQYLQFKKTSKKK
jgi:hypothetical protein